MFRKLNNTTWANVGLEIVEIRQTEKRFQLVVVNRYNHREYTVLNNLLAENIEEAFEEAQIRLREYSTTALLNYYK